MNLSFFFQPMMTDRWLEGMLDDHRPLSLKLTLKLIMITSRTGMGGKYCDEYVCLPVCLSARIT